MKFRFCQELSEICGIHTGDGYLRGKDHRKELDISGNLEEKDYYDKHLKKLFKKVFGINIQCRFFKHRNTYGFVVRDKKIINFMHDLGFPFNKKSNIVQVPKFIAGSFDNKIISKFLRGYFDTDGCIHFWKRNKGKYGEFKKTHHYYPIIRFSTVSNELAKDIKRLLEIMGFGKIGYCTYKPKKINANITYIITLYGSKKIIKFFKDISPKNNVQMSKFKLWKKIGFCPVKLTHNQRIQMLKNYRNIKNKGL